MTPLEQAPYDAGFRAALDMARITAVTIEAGPGPLDLRMRAAAGALYAFADAAGALALSSKGTHQARTPAAAAMAAIAADTGKSGQIPCPECSGRFVWIKDSTNGHVHGRCEAGCFAVMQ